FRRLVWSQAIIDQIFPPRAFTDPLWYSLSQRGIERMLVFARHRNFSKEREVNLIIDRAEFLNLCFTTWFLLQKVIGREAQNFQTLRFFVFIQLLQTFILRSQTTFRCHVHHKQYLALILVYGGFWALNGFDWNVIYRASH